MAKERAEKAAEKAKKAAESAADGKPAAGPSLQDDSTEEQDPSLYYENRVKAIVAKKARGENPYPHKFNVSISVPQYVAKYASLEAGTQLTDDSVSIAGRVVTKRASGAKLLFYDIIGEGQKVQVMTDAR